ncbi:MAG: transposase [Microcystis aeruginosa W11-03]|nr:transposase [Microcystis aeruginosa W11-03]
MLIPPPKTGGHPRTTDMRGVCDAIYYQLKTGCQWGYLPGDFPPPSTVYSYYRKWMKNGIWQALNHTRRDRCREQVGNLNIEKIWFLCLKEMLKQQERFAIKGLVYMARDRTSWGAINILMVSLIYDKRAIPIYGEILDKKGSSNLEEQQRVSNRASI